MRPSCEAQTLGAKKITASVKFLQDQMEEDEVPRMKVLTQASSLDQRNIPQIWGASKCIRFLFSLLLPSVLFYWIFYILLLSPFKPTGKYAIDTGRRTNGCRHIEYITSYPFQSDLWAHPHEISALPSGDFHHHIWLKHTFKIHSVWIKHIFCRFSTMYTHLLQHFIRYTFQRSDPLLTPQLPYFFTA